MTMLTICSSEQNAKKTCGTWHDNPSENTVNLFLDTIHRNTFNHFIYKLTLYLLSQPKMSVEVTETITQFQFK